jgi:formate dehydrogenase subunit gamma
MGAQALQAHASAVLGVEVGQTTVDGLITLEPVYCLGNCACSPSVRVNEQIHARVDPQRFDELMSALSEGGEA